MIWGIVLIPIGLLMAIGIVILLASLIAIVCFRRRHGLTQPLMWWDRVPHDPAALKTGALFRGSKRRGSAPKVPSSRSTGLGGTLAIRRGHLRCWSSHTHFSPTTAPGV